MLDWIVTAGLAVIAWLFWIVLEGLAGEVVSVATAPVRRPIWDAFVRARRPWPLVALLGVGLAAAATGVWTMAHGEAQWVRSVGFLLFLGGSGITLTAPLLWRDARREYARRMEFEIEGDDVNDCVSPPHGPPRRM